MLRSSKEQQSTGRQAALYVLLLIPRIAFRYVVVGLALIPPLLPWFVIIWFFSDVVVLQDPLASWVMILCGIGMLVTVVTAALANPPRPGQRPSLAWRLGGWWARYLPPPIGLARLIRKRKDRGNS